MFGCLFDEIKIYIKRTMSARISPNLRQIVVEDRGVSVHVPVSRSTPACEIWKS